MIYDARSDVERHKALHQIIPSTSLIESDFVENLSRNESIGDSINRLSTPSGDDFEVSFGVKQFDPDEIAARVKKHQIIVQGQNAWLVGRRNRSENNRNDDGKSTIKAKKTTLPIDGTHDRFARFVLESAES